MPKSQQSSVHRASPFNRDLINDTIFSQIRLVGQYFKATCGSVLPWPRPYLIATFYKASHNPKPSRILNLLLHIDYIFTYDILVNQPAFHPVTWPQLWTRFKTSDCPLLIKGVWHEIFDFCFFSWISFPGPLKISKRHQWNTQGPGVNWFMNKTEVENLVSDSL
jgi:hypothetical protein